jgi:hypothetical protein
MHKDEGLRLAGLVENLFVADLVDGLQPLDGLLLGDTNELLLETDGTVRGVKVEETLLDVDTKEGGDILVVGKGSRETDDTDTVVRLIHLANGTRENRLEHGSTVVVEQVDLVNDDEADEVGVARVGGLAGDDVPLLGVVTMIWVSEICCLVSCESPVNSATLMSRALKRLVKAATCSCKRLHRRNVDDLERVAVDDTSLGVAGLLDRAQHGEGSTVCLARTGRRTDEHRLVGLKGNGEDLALNRVEAGGVDALPHWPCPAGHGRHGDELARRWLLALGLGT